MLRAKHRVGPHTVFAEWILQQPTWSSSRDSKAGRRCYLSRVQVMVEWKRWSIHEGGTREPWEDSNNHWSLSQEYRRRTKFERESHYSVLNIWREDTNRMVGPSIGVYVSSPNSSNHSLSENKPDFFREFSRVVCPLYFPVSDNLSLTLLCSTVLEEWHCDWTLEPQETALKFLSTVVSCLLCQWLLPLRTGRMVIPG